MITNAAYVTNFLSLDGSNLSAAEIVDSVVLTGSQFSEPMRVTRDNAAYILDTFPIVRRQDEARWGRYRTCELVLAYWNAYAAGDMLEFRDPASVALFLLIPNSLRDHVVTLCISLGLLGFGFWLTMVARRERRAGGA